MTTDLATIEDAEILAMTPAEFGRRLAELIGGAARLIATAARMLSVWTAAGNDAPNLAGLWRTYLPLVESGAVLPEALSALSFAPSAVVAAALSLPVDLQRRYILGGERVPVCEVTAAGVAVRMLEVRTLTTAHAKLVFSNRTVRDEAEQRAILTAPVATRTRPGKALTVGNVRIDPKTQTLKIVRGDFATVADVLTAIRAHGLDNLGL